MRGRLLTVIVAGFLIGALVGAGALILTTSSSGPKVETSGKALIGGPFTLVDQHGKKVTDRDFRGRYMLIFFGFTHCPDICPAELQVIAASLDDLGPKAEEVVPVFVTLDPSASHLRRQGAVVGPGAECRLSSRWLCDLQPVPCQRAGQRDPAAIG